MLIKILVRIENMFDFGNYSNKSKHYDNSKPLVFGKMKDKMGDVAAEKFVGLKPKIYSIWVILVNIKKQKAWRKCCC